ncbi:hypothetical protein MAPG_03820 [Magnaporthiopsis poae ATCC 64411]|uniref:HNH domain-containing protein n=1 Tax=Magnaporthiopsis poae (strain ATCC 64411 / 73-15) TaxID=644358 RepID=A0A0C4DV20_MAGP6|nr:hypothetical protein MAPG_03820 [Magnaporthiopsis poae ATCC 64411]
MAATLDKIGQESTANFELFRDCLSAVLVERLSPSPSKKSLRKARPRRRDPQPKSNATSSHARSPEESVGAGSVAPLCSTPDEGRLGGDDTAAAAEELGEFIDYIAAASFASLPEDLRSLNHREWTEDPTLSARYPLPLTGGSLSNVLPSVLVNFSGGGPPGPGPERLHRRRLSTCTRVNLSYHHLIPRMVHDKVVRRGWHREDELQNVAWLCGACHRAVHRFANHEDLARHYYTVEKLLAQDEIAAFARWVGRLRWKKK